MNDHSPEIATLYAHRQTEAEIGRSEPDVHWQRMRGHLRAASELAHRAAEAETPEEAKQFLGLSMNQLMDASFWLAYIERDVTDVPLDGLD